MPTHRYDVPSGRVGENFVSILSVELDGIQAQKCNSEWVIVFNHLSYNASDLSLVPKISAHKSSSELTPGILVILTNL